jgi:hypothetical protein
LKRERTTLRNARGDSAKIIPDQPEIAQRSQTSRVRWPPTFSAFFKGVGGAAPSIASTSTGAVDIVTL